MDSAAGRGPHPAHSAADGRRCLITRQQDALERELNSFERSARLAALEALAEMASAGTVTVAPERERVNMHCHTFFSFNGYGHSPASLAWLAKREGFRAIGMVDFDVLDGVEEFFLACDLVGVRGTAGIETRVYVPEFATRVINSPGEPGVCYDMGIGFVTGQPGGDCSDATLRDMRSRADRRNREMLERLNVHLAPVAIDYEGDVLPLTPAGNATERHMLAAIITVVRRSVPDEPGYWSGKLALPAEQIEQTLGNAAKFADLVRARLMKRGGIGYVQPGPNTFPTVEEFHGMVGACAALPCLTWLDGTSDGEQSIDELLDLMTAKGAVALNIIPDRNWNYADPVVRALKVQKLHEVVNVAEARALPLIIGTEMNAHGQKLVDNLDEPELAPLRQAFLDGADFFYGHTVMQRSLGQGFASDWAASQLAGQRERVAFYGAVGRRVPPGLASLRRIQALGRGLAPDDYLRLV